MNELRSLPKARFVMSAGKFSELPRASNDEYCVLGRSNVGKSSFINHVFADRRLAKVSKTPGKTVCVNLFQLSDGTCWADLPGYGFAAKARTEKGRMSDLISDYCAHRENLKGVIWLLDLRHPGMESDKVAYGWFAQLRLPVFPVLTKSDKLSHGRAKEQTRVYRELFGLASPPVAYSIHESAARDRFWEVFGRWAELTAATGGRQPDRVADPEV
jgi:GTP-binding protein